MRAAVAISIEEYLNTSYRPDCDYVDGELRERNVGEWSHSRMQMLLSRYISNREQQWGVVVVPGQRVQVRPDRFRVPDIIAVSAPARATPIVYDPPLLCIEILSREDRMSEMLERVDDYISFGVSCVWVLDPRTHRAFVYTAEGMHEPKDGVLRAGSDIAVPMAELES